MTDFSKKEKIKRITQGILGLSALPTIIAKMIELVDNPKTSASTLGKLISTDQVLTARVLKLANSAFYGFPRRISTINLAIVVLGFDTLKDLGLSFSIINRFSSNIRDTGFDMSRFWEHSIGCGVAGKMLAKRYRYRITGEVFVAGLLHDIGKLVVNQYITEDFKKIQKKVNNSGVSFIEAEKEILGVTHAEIGKWLVEKWNLPSQLCDSIAYHHKPLMSKKNRFLASIINFSDYLCKIANIGYSGDDIIPEISPEIVKVLKLKQNEDGDIDIDFYKDLLYLELDRAETFINIIQGKDVPEKKEVKIKV
ncbi:HD family phosphohydrolase [candidate division KSB1 bacterium]|nr:MAG: HD family phosphohydrolase [candidate division KSB1 bacterium]